MRKLLEKLSSCFLYRMDWHLLSTVSPALNAWLNPSDHLKQSAQKMIAAYETRKCTIIAFLMIEALEAQSIHVPLKRKYQRLTPLAKSILDDPSCQLLVVLIRYLNKKENAASIQEKLGNSHIPHLDTLRRGIMAVSRQWKNILYIPVLVEQSLKLKSNLQAPANVSFRPNFTKVNDSQFPIDGERYPLFVLFVGLFTFWGSYGSWTTYWTFFFKYRIFIRIIAGLS